MKIKNHAIAMIVALGLPLIGCQGGSEDFQNYSSTSSEQNDSQNITDPTDTTAEDSHDIADHIHNDISEAISEDIQALGCVKASTSQKKQVNLGLSKKEEFLQKCSKETNGSSWCDELVRPNPRSSNTFKCTYGSSQAHNLIHPVEGTWKYPIEGVRILQDLSAKGIKISQIYNWWRPEPYNKNVGGAAGRHPYGTSIDVRFSSNSEADRAFRELCKMRKAKRLRAIGHYGSASLHIGVGDRTANTWGKSCN
ncbi:hypothetical protein AB1A81_17090 [Bdellovibrio bacteriovorus]|nr:hypothetical protein [Bdellovibrio bacteriovorus]